MTTTLVKIVHTKEMRTLVNIFKKIGLNSKGTIFGGLVRDEIIGTHYRQKFIDKDLDFDKYWTPTYDIETCYRTILPSDMDIYFKNDIDSNSFIVSISEFVKQRNGSIYIANIANRTLFDTFQYNHNNSILFKHTKIIISFNIGKTFTYHGYKISFNIDVITNNNAEDSAITDNQGRSVVHIEPPFYNLDFLCNVFIMEKINDITNIRISNCTGTPIDDMPFANKMKFANMITENIIKFKTEFTRSISNSNTEYINTYRILKMINKGYGWNITNLPFKVYNNINFPYEADTSCCICIENIVINKKPDCVDGDYVLIPFNNQKGHGNIMHYNCFYNYLEREQRKKYRNPETNCIECRCPFRNPFNFKDCHKTVSYELE